MEFCQLNWLSYLKNLQENKLSFRESDLMAKL